MWKEALGDCPAGHWKYPSRLLAFHLEGVLREDPWRIEGGDGKVTLIPFKGMPGHHGRMALVTVLDIQWMAGQMKGMSPEDLAKVDLAKLKTMLDRLRTATRK